MSKRILGLDLGTNSIGWAVVEKDDGEYKFVLLKDKNEKSIPSKGCYIFTKGTTGSENSKAAERRGYRSPRKRTNRTRNRKIATLKVLDKYSLCPPFTYQELNDWKYKKRYPVNNHKFIEWQRTGNKKDKGDESSEKLKQPYYYRHLAATQGGLMRDEVGRKQLGRAFYHLSQRRGYLSNGEEEQSEDRLEQFKDATLKTLKNTEFYSNLLEAFNIIADLYKGDINAKKISTKIKRFIKKEASLSKISDFINFEFNKPENLGKVAQGIKNLTTAITEEGCSTLGSYFYSIYAKEDKYGVVNKIRGRYTHREEHYENEFYYICDKQELSDEIREELHTAIFFQRELKSQDNLIAKCPLEPNKKRISISHPLFEEFRMWESINRIKIKFNEDSRLRFLTKEEKDILIDIFQRKNDFEFKTIAKQLSNGQTFRYIKDKENLEADIEFNFPMNKKFSACPTTYDLKKALGKEYHNFASRGKNNLSKKVSIEDAWKCLSVKSFGSKTKEEYREYFVKKWLTLDDVNPKLFSKINLSMGYGSLSKEALEKIIPHLKDGFGYSHSVFLANVANVLGRCISKIESKNIKEVITESLNHHKSEKDKNGIINKCIDSYKANSESLGDNKVSVDIFKKEVNTQIIGWFGINAYDKLQLNEQEYLKVSCWELFRQTVKDKLNKEVKYIKTDTIPTIIYDKLIAKFPTDINTIDIHKLYHPSAIEAYPKVDKRLGNPEISAIKNPVFNRAMHQVKKLINELIEKGIIDKDTHINLEVANEINTANYRRSLSRWQKEQEDIRIWAKDKIKELYLEECKKEIEPTNDEIAKFLYWKEQNHSCLYTSKHISICDFLGGNTTYDIEHTIPRSKFNDNSNINKTLTHARFNREIKGTNLPALIDTRFEGTEINSETIVSNRDKFLKSYQFLKSGPIWDISINTLKKNVTKYNNAAKAISDPSAHDDIKTQEYYNKIKLEYLSDKYKTFEYDEIPARFSNANLVDTRLIAKYARAYLNSYFSRVNVINGKITDTMRKVWGLQSENERKDRSNHIHHCIDAITVACIGKGTVHRLSEAYHKYEKKYFDNYLNNAKVYLPVPMKDFVKTIKNLHKEVLIHYQQQDRKKLLITRIERKKKEPSKNIDTNLRGALNKPNPYGHIKTNNELSFVQRKAIAKIKGSDIPNIVDEGIKRRIITLAETCGLESFFAGATDEKVNQQKIELCFTIYKQLYAKDKKGSFFAKQKNKNDFPSSYADINELIHTINDTIINSDLSIKDKFIAEKRVIEVVKSVLSTKGLGILLKESNGILILPAYNNAKTGKEIKQVVIKKVRLKTGLKSLKSYKEYRQIDQSKKEYKRDFYFAKEAGSNYEARIYGSLLPNENGKLESRNSEIINTYDIINRNAPRISDVPILQLHAGDMVLVYDKSIDEINWEDLYDLQTRLFTVVKFVENKAKQTIKEIIFKRHNYALGNVDGAESIKDTLSLKNEKEYVLRKSPSALTVIPTKINKLGMIDIDYSRDICESHYTQE